MSQQWWNIVKISSTDFWSPFKFLPHDATQSAVMPQYIVDLFICPSVRDVLPWSHRLEFVENDCTASARADPNMGDLVQREHLLNLRWNSGGVTHEPKKICNIQYPKRCIIGPRLDYYDGLIGSRIRAFDWYQNQYYGLSIVLTLLIETRASQYWWNIVRISSKDFSSPRYTGPSWSAV